MRHGPTGSPGQIGKAELFGEVILDVNTHIKQSPGRKLLLAIEDLPCLGSDVIFKPVAQGDLIGAAPAIELCNGIQEITFQQRRIGHCERPPNRQPAFRQDFCNGVACAMKPGMAPCLGRITVKMTIFWRPDHHGRGRPVLILMLASNSNGRMEKHEQIVPHSLGSIDDSLGHHFVQSEHAQSKRLAFRLTNGEESQFFHRLKYAKFI